MQIELTKKEFRLLLDMVYIGNWILNSTRGEDRFATGEFDLCQCVSCHGSQEQVSERTADGDQHRIKDVARERNPRGVHQHEQVAEVGEGGVLCEESRGVHPQFIQRLERLRHRIDHRKEHDHAEDRQKNGNTCVAARRAGQDDLVLSCS